MTVAREIKQLNAIVENLLRVSVIYRDSDQKLCARIWAIQLGGDDVLKSISAYEFLLKYTTGKLYSQESIGRARRKLQEEDESLRGKKYNQRQNETTAVQTVLGYI